MVKAISILGSTGSIGRQTVAAALRLGLPVRALAAHGNIRLLEEQARQLRPDFVAVYDPERAQLLRTALADTSIRVAGGPEALTEAAVTEGADCVVTAVSGAVGLVPTLAAIRERRRVALANKETLVCAGELVMALVRETGTELIPVDSEHSAIFQSLLAGRRAELRRILLTASGGPFRGRKRAELYAVTPKEAVAHPNWSMGAKISVDSATLMNKGLELIEAMHLFSCPPEAVEILVHPESVVHSAVEFLDGSVVAQMGVPDMGIPIQYALTYPERRRSGLERLDLLRLGQLHFLPPDTENFPCLAIAMDCARKGGTAPAVMNAANEVAVARFLREELPFGEIPRCIAWALRRIGYVQEPDFAAIAAADREARALAAEYRLEDGRD